MEYNCSIPRSLIVEKGQKDSVFCEVILSNAVEAPVEQGQVVGEVSVYANSQLVGTYPITALRRVEKTDFFTEFRRLLREAIQL